ncbi:hypothetical protein FISHEDRAFT_68429 [Fistulina hepatica ATCC 64428]|uniref:BRCT domain-containing protein n=1 Tax=Fistulina hepatica ATCC 64428 TaxID=1128425 RepID=A0A0D7AQ41_9AGAR|nr:hypothetical protein FISHEDRAFT_68429 [Fistulina hepatica ATCC 64428]
MNRRRTNKSAKVPNVKLRPAVPRPRKHEREHERDATPLDTQLQLSDGMLVDRCPRPFKGVLVCATGVVDKPTLFKQAVELGATCSSALTDRVTHLVANGHGSAKYTCALERGIPIMSESWITTAYETWLRGDDVDLEDSVKLHRIPVFEGVVLCVSGIADVKRRTEINRLVTRHGGQYVKSIERPVRVTHLLCTDEAAPGTTDGRFETDKMHYAEKFNRNREADIKLVWEDWFWDSLEFGGRFDEEKYLVRTTPRPIHRRVAGEASTSSARAVEQSASADDEEEQRALVRPLALPVAPTSASNQPSVDSTALHVWASLLRTRGFVLDSNGAEIKRDLTAAQRGLHSFADKAEIAMDTTDAGAGDSVAQEPVQEAGDEQDAPNTIAALRRGNAFQDEARTKSIGFGVMDVVSSPDTESSKRSDTTVKGHFSGHTFALIGEATSFSVRDALTHAGGLILQGDVGFKDADFILLRLGELAPSSVAEQGDLSYDAYRKHLNKYRTECWLEKCMYTHRSCSPDEHVTFRPLCVTIRLGRLDSGDAIPQSIDMDARPSLAGVRVSFSGLDAPDACWVRRLLLARGAEHLPVFSRETTYLFCPAGADEGEDRDSEAINTKNNKGKEIARDINSTKGGPKCVKAREWGIPIVGRVWLKRVACGNVERHSANSVVESAMEDVTAAVNNRHEHHPLFGPPDPALLGKRAMPPHERTASSHSTRLSFVQPNPGLLQGSPPLQPGPAPLPPPSSSPEPNVVPSSCSPSPMHAGISQHVRAIGAARSPTGQPLTSSATSSRKRKASVTDAGSPIKRTTVVPVSSPTTENVSSVRHMSDEGVPSVPAGRSTSKRLAGPSSRGVSVTSPVDTFAPARPRQLKDERASSARALQDSIASLVGKRVAKTVSCGSSDLASSGSSSMEGLRHDAKIGRKAFSSGGLGALSVEQRHEKDCVRRQRRMTRMSSSDSPFMDGEVNPFARAPTIESFMESYEEEPEEEQLSSVRVTYMDPAQNEEKHRLMRLVENEDEGTRTLHGTMTEVKNASVLASRRGSRTRA